MAQHPEKPIRILITGGTIDKDYNKLAGQLVLGKTHLQDILEQARCRVPVRVEQLMLVDSLEMTEENRQTVLQRCIDAPEERIIITHGTDTMVETARLLGGNALEKTIALVGAMIPYTFGRSDALFNLGCAFSTVQVMGHGVYITMNGRIFYWDNVRKNTSIGDFELLEDPGTHDKER